MSKVLIAYVSRTGNTEKMAEYLAEGVRIAGQEAVIAKKRIFKTKRSWRNTTALFLDAPLTTGI